MSTNSKKSRSLVAAFERVSGHFLRATSIGQSLAESRRSYFTYLSAAVFMVGGLVGLVADLASHKPISAVALQLSFLLLLAASLVAAKHGLIRFSKYWILALGNLWIFYSTAVFGPSSGVILLFLPAAALPFLLFSPSNLKSLCLCVALPLASLFLLHDSSSLIPFLPFDALGQSPRETIWYVMLFTTIGALFAIIAYFAAVCESHSRRISASLTRQSTAYGLVVHDITGYLFTASAAVHALARTTAAQDDKERLRIQLILTSQIDQVNVLVGGLRACLRSVVEPEGEPPRAHLGLAAKTTIELLDRRGFLNDVHCSVLEGLNDCVAQISEENLSHILDNLVINALQNFETNKITNGNITIGVVPSGHPAELFDQHGRGRHQRKGEAEAFTVYITDNGTGLTADDFNRITVESPRSEKESQPNVETPARFPRKSHGLALVRQLVEQSSNEIWCVSPAILPKDGRQTPTDSAPRPGTTFFIRLARFVEWPAHIEPGRHLFWRFRRKSSKQR